MDGIYEKTTLGIRPNVAGLCCYALGWVSGIFFLIAARDNKFVRFHALQSIFVWGVITVIGVVLWFLPPAGWALGIPLIILSFLLWKWTMYAAYKGEMYKLPLAGRVAEKLIKSKTTERAKVGIKLDPQNQTLDEYIPASTRKN